MYQRLGTLVAMRGSIRQRGPDEWQVRVSAGRDPASGRYRYVSRTVHGGKRQAQRAAAELVAEVDKDKHEAAAPRGSVAQLLDQWMDHITAQGRAPSTLMRYRSAIDGRIVPVLGPIEVARLTAGALDVADREAALAIGAVAAALMPAGQDAAGSALSQDAPPGPGGAPPPGVPT